MYHIYLKKGNQQTTKTNEENITTN